MLFAEYDRTAAVNYALKWAFSRNPNYLDFHGLGGDCTNFVSQCIFAGSGVMNYTKTFGWYYISSSNRTPSWTGVEYFNKFFSSNQGVGPFASEVPLEKAMLGDVIQFGDENYHFFHTAIITKIDPIPSPATVFVASHSYDTDYRRVASYSFDSMRVLHIEGVRLLS